MKLLDIFRKKPTEEEMYTELRSAVSGGSTVTIKKIIERHPHLLNQQDEKGMTLLHLAAELQVLSSVACLIDLGADTEIKDEFGYDPETIAYSRGEYRMGAYTDICLKIVERIKEGPKK